MSFLHMTYICQALAVSIKLPQSHRHPERVVVAAVPLAVLLLLSVRSVCIISNWPNHVFASVFVTTFSRMYF